MPQVPPAELVELVEPADKDEEAVWADAVAEQAEAEALGEQIHQVLVGELVEPGVQVLQAFSETIQTQLPLQLLVLLAQLVVQRPHHIPNLELVEQVEQQHLVF
jgi:hypothetical protein